MGKRLKIFWSIVIAFALLIEPITTKRGGGGFGRGGSVGRGTSAGRGGWTGGRGSSNTGRSSGGWSGTGVGHGRQTPTKSGGHGFGGYASGPSKFKSGSGAGSFIRGSTFKNMVVGAAAGYLTYQAGKALIRNIAAPIGDTDFRYWNNRPYYWGSGYYRPPASGGHMCHMPVDPSDPQLGNVYYQNERPKEIVWGCGYNEVCCGYECCPAGGYGGGGYGGYGWNGGSRIGLGSIVVLLLFCACGAFVFHQICKARRGGGDSFFGGRKYERGEAVYTERAEPPPQYAPAPGMPHYPPPPQPRSY